MNEQSRLTKWIDHTKCVKQDERVLIKLDIHQLEIRNTGRLY